MLPVISIAYVVLVIILIWMVESVPLYVAPKIVVGRKASFPKAMVGALIGPIILVFIWQFLNILLTPAIGTLAVIAGGIAGFLALIYFYDSLFESGLIAGGAIALLTIAISVIVFAFVALLFRFNPFGLSLHHALGSSHLYL